MNNIPMPNLNNINRDQLIEKIKKQPLFPTSSDPEKWIQWMTMVWLVYAVFTLTSFIGGFFNFFIFAIGLGVLGYAIYVRERLWFGYAAIALVPALLLQFYRLMKSFGFGFSIRTPFAILFSLLGLAQILYTGFCCHKMYTQFPEGLHHSQQGARPLARGHESLNQGGDMFGGIGTALGGNGGGISQNRNAREFGSGGGAREVAGDGGFGFGGGDGRKQQGRAPQVGFGGQMIQGGAKFDDGLGVSPDRRNESGEFII